jgi:hypothetical protein
VRPFDRLPFVGALAIAAALVVVGVYLDLRWSSVWALVGFAAAAAVFCGLFLAEYRLRPMAGPAPSAAGAGSSPGDPPGAPLEELADEEDPVMEADRIASGEVLADVVEEPEPGEVATPPAGP